MFIIEDVVNHNKCFFIFPFHFICAVRFKFIIVQDVQSHFIVLSELDCFPGSYTTCFCSYREFALMIVAESKADDIG